MAGGMDTTSTAPITANEVFERAAHMPGMNTLNAAALAADALRQSTVTANYDATHERVNAVARKIAEEALAVTGGRSTYSWEGNGIRLTYTGDTVDDHGDFAYGPTIREYLVDGEYKTTAPTPSQSGTGLLNLALDHVRDCHDPIVEAKRQIAWLLLDPSLDLVEYVIRTTTQWHAMAREPHKTRVALNIRLHEIIEQKVMQNPGSGLDLHDLVNGVNVVGWMVKTLDGCVRPIMNRIRLNEGNQATTLDTPVDDDDAYRRPIAELATEQLPQSAEMAAISGAVDARATATLEAMYAEQDAVKTAREGNAKVRSRRAQEKAAIVARTFFAQTGLPTPIVPSVAVREQLLAELDEEQAAYAELVKKAEKAAAAEAEAQGVKVPVVMPDRATSIAYRSFLAWHNLVHGEFGEDVPDEWLSLWESYSDDDTETMIGHVGSHPERLEKVVRGVLAVPEKMNAATKLRIRNAFKRIVDNEELNELVAAAVTKYDEYRRGGDFAAWDLAARTVMEHQAAPKMKSVEELGAMFDDAIYSLGLD